MFLCEKCAPKFEVSEFQQIVGPFSVGPCEGCGKTRTCVDAHLYIPTRDTGVPRSAQTGMPLTVNEKESDSNS